MFEKQEKSLKKEEKKQQDNIDLTEKIEKNKYKGDLNNLKHLIEENIAEKDLIVFINNKDDFSEKNKEIKSNKENFVEKFEEIFENENIKKILPSNLIINKKEYQEAIKNPEIRKEILQKIDDSLGIIYRQYKGNSPFKRNMFSNYVNFFSNNIIDLQAKIIDLKNYLINI